MSEKLALLAEMGAESGKVTVVTQRHRISESVLYNGQAVWKPEASSMQAAGDGTVHPVAVVGGSGQCDTAMLAPSSPKPPSPPRQMRVSDSGIGGQWL
jgi:hypothetical protein